MGYAGKCRDPAAEGDVAKIMRILNFTGPGIHGRYEAESRKAVAAGGNREELDAGSHFPAPGNLVAAAGSPWDTMAIFNILASLIHGNLSKTRQFGRGSTMIMLD